MKKFNLLVIFLILALAIGAVASEDVEDSRTQFDLIFNVIDFGDYIEVNVALPSDAQGIVNYTINDEHYEVNIVNGEAKLNITGLEAGEYILKANYSGDDRYMSIENQTVITVEDAENSTDNGTNAAGGDENATPKNDTPVQKDNPVQNNTTVIIVINQTQNQTQNQTPVVNNTTDDNVTTTVDNSSNPPKKEPDRPPFNIDAKTGIPIVFVIIAIVILIAVRKYEF